MYNFKRFFLKKSTKQLRRVSKTLNTTLRWVHPTLLANILVKNLDPRYHDQEIKEGLLSMSCIFTWFLSKYLYGICWGFFFYKKNPIVSLLNK